MQTTCKLSETKYKDVLTFIRAFLCSSVNSTLLWFGIDDCDVDDIPVFAAFVNDVILLVFLREDSSKKGSKPCSGISTQD